jgi:ABC-type cobalt transport system substrate-binding protein
MKKVILLSVSILLAAALLVYGLTLLKKGEWSGVDETVVEKYAEAAGRPAWKPFINTEQGDMLLFFFLIAGTCGGFVAGYCFRELFVDAKEGAGAQKLRLQHD